MERNENNLSRERKQEKFKELFRQGKWLDAFSYALQNGLPMHHEDSDLPEEERTSANEAIRRIMERQDRAKQEGDRVEFDRLEEEYKEILFFFFDPEFAREEYDQTKRNFDDE